MKIIPSLIASVVAGLLLGYITSKIILLLQLQSISLIFAIVMGFGAGFASGTIAQWVNIRFVGILVSILVGVSAYFNLQYHLYLPIKFNPPQDSPAFFSELKTTPEFNGFFKYVRLTASDEVEVYTRRRGKHQSPKILIWVLEMGAVIFMSYIVMDEMSKD